VIALRLIQDAKAAGCSLEIEDGDLVVEADREPPAELIASLRRHKAELVAALLPRGDALPARQAEAREPETAPKAATTADADVWIDFYEERAAIREFDGHYTRAEAEVLAWGELENRWHLQHGERVPRNLCAGCRKPIGISDALDLIDGNRVHLADDRGCLIRHGERWRAAATCALTALGLRPPATAVEG
jgi:hypothetical protein